MEQLHSGVLRAGTCLACSLTLAPGIRVFSGKGLICPSMMFGVYFDFCNHMALQENFVSAKYFK
jgi:hypothetical protein